MALSYLTILPFLHMPNGKYFIGPDISIIHTGHEIPLKRICTSLYIFLCRIQWNASGTDLYKDKHWPLCLPCIDTTDSILFFFQNHNTTGSFSIILQSGQTSPKQGKVWWCQCSWWWSSPIPNQVGGPWHPTLTAL